MKNLYVCALAVALPVVALGASKTTIAIFESETNVQLGTVSLQVPGRPEKTITNCDNVGKVGFQCDSTTYPATQPGILDTSVSTVGRTVRIILNDGSHAMAHCLLSNKKCLEVTPANRTSHQHCEDFSVGTTFYHDCRWTADDIEGVIGKYKAKRDGDKLTIYTSSGKAEYTIIDKW